MVNAILTKKTKYHDIALLSAQHLTHIHDRPATGIDARPDAAITKQVDKFCYN